jgi:SAM-dependent methyltransferase
VATKATDTINCRNCGGASGLFLSSPDINRRVSTTNYNLYRCDSCGLLFVGNPPNDLSRYYPPTYHPAMRAVGQLVDPHGLHQYRLDLVRKYKRSGTLLEIGPSAGIFCNLAKDSGFDVSAIEMDFDCVQFLTKQIGVRATHSSDPAKVIADEARQYDVICLWHSIEHIFEPWALLDQCARHLAPDGILVVATPNPDAWQARVMGQLWPHYDLPRHLVLLPIGWIQTFASRHTLSVELLTTRDKTSVYLSIGSWRDYFARPPDRSLADRLLRYLGLAIGLVLAPWEARQGRGAAYTAIFRRPR